MFYYLFEEKWKKLEPVRVPLKFIYCTTFLAYQNFLIASKVDLKKALYFVEFNSKRRTDKNTILNNLLDDMRKTLKQGFLEN